MSRILVVDDEGHATRLLRRRLEDEGYGVDVASDGEEALEKLGASSFDLLITDVCMPRMGGRELCERVREREPEGQLRILVVSSNTEDEHREWARALSNVEFIEKPLSLRHLLARVARSLGAADPPEGRPR